LACIWCVLCVEPLGSQELAWFSSIVASSLDRLAAEAAINQLRLAPSKGAPSWSLGTESPWSIDQAIGSLNAEARALLKVSSSGTGPQLFAWEFGLGAGANAIRDSGTDPLYYELGPAVTLSLDLRFAKGLSVKDQPSERLRSVELGGRLRSLEREAKAGILTAAANAARSASAKADEEYATAKSAYLEKEARRTEIEMNAGRVSRAAYAEAQDAWERAKSEVEDWRYQSEAYGRAARSPADTEAEGEMAIFSSASLYDIGQEILKLCQGEVRTEETAEDATAPWDILQAQLEQDSIAEAPRFHADIQAQGIAPMEGRDVQAATDGTLSLFVPLGTDTRARDRQGERIEERRNEAMRAAIDEARRGFKEAWRGASLADQRVKTLSLRVVEREQRSAAWTRLAEGGAAAILDSLAAKMSQAEAQAAQDRAKASFFLAALAVFDASGLSVASLADLPERGAQSTENAKDQ